MERGEVGWVQCRWISAYICRQWQIDGIDTEYCTSTKEPVKQSYIARSRGNMQQRLEINFGFLLIQLPRLSHVEIKLFNQGT
jgi:hypothetical protein